MSNRARRPTPLQLALIGLCLGGFVYALAGPVLDGLDRRYPDRERVAALSDPAVQLEVNLAEEDVDSAAARSALQVLPAPLVRLLREFGGRVVFTDLAALEAMHPDDTNITHTAGLYVREQRIAYIAHDTGEPGLTALHEIGHMIDHALFDLSSSEAFLRIYEDARQNESLGAGWRDDTREFFADFFARYYFSDARRNWLASRFPEARQYFANLEESASACSQLSCFGQ